MTLTVIWLLPLLASLLIAFMPPRLAKSMAVLVSLVTLGITIGVALVFAPGLTATNSASRCRGSRSFTSSITSVSTGSASGWSSSTRC